jgi:F-box-like
MPNIPDEVLLSIFRYMNEHHILDGLSGESSPTGYHPEPVLALASQVNRAWNRCANEVLYEFIRLPGLPPSQSANIRVLGKLSLSTYYRLVGWDGGRTLKAQHP